MKASCKAILFVLSATVAVAQAFAGREAGADR
jgi:hypothetical protein